jgi:hypothetical protein
VLRIRDVYPGSRIPDPGFGSQIPDNTKTTRDRGEKRCCAIFFVAKNITKEKIILFLNRKR